jgi:hypothetical protein
MTPAANWKEELRNTMVALGLIAKGENLTGATSINWNNGKISDMVKPVRFK